MAKTTTLGIWEAIGNDVAGLIRDAGRLRVELIQTREKASKDQKQLLLDMLDTLDSFDRVFANIEPRLESADRQARIWAGNFRTVRKVLENHVRDRGVTRIEAPEGKAVPGYHTVVDTRENLDLEDETILEEVQKGYLWRGEVLRKAQVITVKN